MLKIYIWIIIIYLEHKNCQVKPVCRKEDCYLGWFLMWRRKWIKAFCEDSGLSYDDLDFVLKETQHYNLQCYTYASTSNGHFDNVVLS